MRKSAKMKLVELMILHQDIDDVLEYLGTHADFQMRGSDSEHGPAGANPDFDMLSSLQSCRTYLGIPDPDEYITMPSLPTDVHRAAAADLIASIESRRTDELSATVALGQAQSAWDEARSFANLKVSWSELDHLTFFTFRIGRIDPALFDALCLSVGDRAVITALGEDRGRILAASSKKGRFALDSELKKFDFVALEVPKDFKGVPEDLLSSLKRRVEEAEVHLGRIVVLRTEFAKECGDELVSLIQSFSLASQVREVRSGLETTEQVYRLSGWISADDSDRLMHDLDEIAEGRAAITIYDPDEINSVRDGIEKVPVRFRHNAFVKSFERMIFSYGAPLYGTIDPTPIVAFFFTLLFGIMFGDLGQGAVFFLLGCALLSGLFPVINRWRHFGLIFIAIGCSSMSMGLLTGEFFANSDILKPFGRWVTGSFGEPRDEILSMMPSKNSLLKLFVFFGFTLSIGFVINSMGLLINIVNQFSLRKPAKAIFSKTGICGAVFFWYAVFVGIRIALSGGGVLWFDYLCLGLPLVGLFFAEPLGRCVEGERPIFENGLFAAAIGGFVEVLEVISTYISNSVSFLRVGAFALSHAVLSYITFTMTDLVGGTLSAGGFAVSLFGNLVIIVLEGLIVAIQVVRLQYYEFFSKFFTETGREFKPLRFRYKE